MPQIDMQLVQWIADRLRYLQLPHLIGSLYQIQDLRSLEADLSTSLSEVLTDLGKMIDPEPRWIKQTLAKYHVLDLTFELSAHQLDGEILGGLELLQELGFLMDSMEAEQFDYVASLVGDNFEDPTLLGELEADLQANQTVLRIILESIDETQKTFSVINACITNAASVWLHKYPYY